MKSSDLCDTQFTNLDPLRPRDALFGGRTNSTKLYHDIDESTQDELKYTLIQSYKRTPNVIYASSKSKNQLMCFFISINKSRLCRGSKSYFISKRRIRLAQTKSQ